MSRSGRRLLVLGALAAFAAGSLTIPIVRSSLHSLVYRFQRSVIRPFTEEGALDQLETSARKAATANDYQRADMLLREWASRWKGEPGELAAQRVYHAGILVKLGRSDEAFALLRQAFTGGYHDELRFSENEAFGPLRADPRYVEVKGLLHDYAQRLEQARREARRIPRDWVPSSPITVASVKESLENRDPQLFKADSGSPIDQDWTVRSNRGIARVVASLRYIASHTEDPAIKADAEWEGLRVSSSLISASIPTWDVEESQQLVSDCDRFLTQTQSNERHREALLYKALALGRGVRTVGWQYDRDDPPPADCQAALPLLDTLSQSTASDRVTVIARVERARCLVQEGLADRAAATQALVDYEALPEVGWREWMFFEPQFRSDARLLRMKLDGPPPFEAPMLNGGVANLAMLRGKVSLIEFWSPG